MPLGVWEISIVNFATMDIDLTSIIIGIIALAFFFVPVIYYEYIKKRSTKKITAFFKEEALKRNIQLTQSDVWRDRYGIGVDSNTHKLIYFKKNKDQDEFLVIDLKEIKKCRISKEDKRVKTEKGNLSITTKVALLCEHVRSASMDITLELYKGDKDNSVRDEIALAEKWSKILNSKFTKG